MRTVLLVALVGLLGACSLRAGPDGATRTDGHAVVSRPVDGDTIEVRIDRVVERVRLIGIDTPESVARDRPVECYGVEAKVRMAELLPVGSEVRLERDVEARDKYGRLLAYVFRVSDGTHINLLLVQEGFAEARAFAPNTALQGELDRAEAEAKAARRGLWPACGSTNVAVAPPPG